MEATHIQVNAAEAGESAPAGGCKWGRMALRDRNLLQTLRSYRRSVSWGEIGRSQLSKMKIHLGTVVDGGNKIIAALQVIAGYAIDPRFLAVERAKYNPVRDFGRGSAAAIEPMFR